MQEDQAFLLQQILDHFFSEDAIMMLPLSNSKVQEELCNNNTTNPSEIQLKLLKKAKTDSSIWSEGLDPNYKTFLASLPASNLLTACLLSIL